LFLESSKIFTEKSKSIYEIPYRKNHIAHAIGPLMFIHGGILENGKITNEVALLEFGNLKWNRIEFRGKSPFLAFHTSDVVLENAKNNIKNFHIYKPIVANDSKNNYKIKHEGIFIFGGIDEENNHKNDLYILKIGRKPLEWYNPKIKGLGPAPRIYAKMNFYEDLNILILHGGRNDTLKKSIFNDIWVFDLENFFWINASTNPYTPKDRTEHGSFIFDNKLLILGGVNIRKFNSMDFYIVNLDVFRNKQREDIDFKECENKNKIDS